ncbi:MAG: hypothetical protein NVSMB19_15200 [Vulcanimicrobiaceae bacterium]
MIAGAARAPFPPRRSESLLLEGLRLMRERLAVYVSFAAISALAGWLVWPHLDMYDLLATHPAALVSTPPVSVVLLLALAALFFILPSAMRRIEPGFRMTAWRIALMLCTLVSVGAVTELGYAFAVLPGIVAAVLLSQVLVGALLRERVGTGVGSVPRTIADAFRSSVVLTRSHFVTTLGVIVASLAILIVPFSIVLFWLAVLGVRAPPSLAFTAPALLLTFVYFECVRYALIVRWYRRLRAEDRPLAPT